MIGRRAARDASTGTGARRRRARGRSGRQAGTAARPNASCGRSTHAVTWLRASRPPMAPKWRHVSGADSSCWRRHPHAWQVTTEICAVADCRCLLEVFELLVHVIPSRARSRTLEAKCPSFRVGRRSPMRAEWVAPGLRSPPRTAPRQCRHRRSAPLPAATADPASGGNGSRLDRPEPLDRRWPRRQGARPRASSRRRGGAGAAARSRRYRRDHCRSPTGRAVTLKSSIRREIVAVESRT